MDDGGADWHYSNMIGPARSIPAYGLYGETQAFPDIMHCERIADRAAPNGWRIRPHRHGALHQFFLISGPPTEVSVDGERLALDRPTLLSIPRWTVHAFRFQPGARGFVLSVPVDSVPEVLGPEAECAGRIGRWRTASAGAGVALHFGTIREELAGAQPLRAARLRANVVEIAAALLRTCSPDRPAPAGPPEARHMRAFEALLRRRLRERWSVERYAAELGVSATHLSRVTRTLTGLSASRFIEARLFQEARRLLAYTRAPVAEVGYALGFEDPAYFSRAFRRCVGTSPSRYRAGVGGAADGAPPH
jgi:AraC family transcriptional activator of pobA